MPLEKSPSKAAVGRNIEREMDAGKPHKQAVAIALDVQRRAGGGKPKPRKRGATKRKPHHRSNKAKRESGY